MYVLPGSFAMLTSVLGKRKILISYLRLGSRWLVRVSTFDLRHIRLQIAKLLTVAMMEVRKGSWFETALESDRPWTAIIFVKTYFGFSLNCDCYLKSAIISSISGLRLCILFSIQD